MEKSERLKVFAIVIVQTCPICESFIEDASVFMEVNIDSSKLSNFSFALRKVPEWMCNQLFRCHQCSLMYAPNLLTVDEFAQAYHEASYDNNKDINDAAKSYAHAVSSTLKNLPAKNSALEIGSGTGVFLDHLLGMGFENVVGIEPSMAAIKVAPENRQKVD